MPRDLGRLLCLIALSCLASCKPPPPPAAQQAQFVPPPPTKPTDRPPICARPEEVDASKVIGVQTQLMQIALSCGRDDQYDTFVRKFQPQLKAQRDVLGGFFARAYGRYHSQALYDEYITQLADAESNYNLSSGGDFCSLSTGTLDQADALVSTDDLEKFVAKVPVQQSTDFELCGTPGAPPVTATATPLRHHWKHYHHKKE
jgi:hypothetical protein